VLLVKLTDTVLQSLQRVGSLAQASLTISQQRPLQWGLVRPAAAGPDHDDGRVVHAQQGGGFVSVNQLSIRRTRRRKVRRVLRFAHDNDGGLLVVGRAIVLELLQARLQLQRHRGVVHGRDVVARSRRHVGAQQLGGRVVDGLPAAAPVGIEVDVVQPFFERRRVKDNGVGVATRARPAVLQVETGQVLQQLVERLLLVLARLAQSECLVHAEFLDAVALEDVILSHPVELIGRVVPHAFHLKHKEPSCAIEWSSSRACIIDWHTWS
jgi:hypothetical protein